MNKLATPIVHFTSANKPNTKSCANDELGHATILNEKYYSLKIILSNHSAKGC